MNAHLTAAVDAAASIARPGTVYLVGAGPGQMGLVSAHALQLVATADTLIYDRLIPAELVTAAPPGCDLIDAGKRAGDHTLSQDDINALLVDAARQGRAVVRLKGGDPFVFGRGGEEGAYVRAAGIPFEVVSGVTSGISVPASAGIPVTHRGVSNHVTLVTASAGPDGSGEPDYPWLAASDGTVVLFMGLRRVRTVAAGLIGAGAPADRPVAVISRGTTARQRTVTGTLATIADLVDDAALASPALIVVGDVVSLRDELNWFEQRPLFGRRIVVTRARAQASGLASQLRDLGADVVEAPTISIEPINTEGLHTAIGALDGVGMLIFTSRNGVDRWFETLHAAGLDARSMAGIRIAVVGAATADACRRRGIEPDVIPSTATSLGLLSHLSAEPMWGTRVVVVRAETGEEQLISGLRDLGADVQLVVAYRTVVETPSDAVLDQVAAADIVTFTAASTVRNLAAVLGDRHRPPAISIGPRTSAAAADLDWPVVGEADRPGVDGIVEALLNHYAVRS